MPDSTEKIKVKVKILDQEYLVVGEEDETYVQELAEYVDERMRQIKNAVPNLSLSKTAILVCLNLADELFKTQREYENLLRLIEEEKK